MNKTTLITGIFLLFASSALFAQQMKNTAEPAPIDSTEISLNLLFAPSVQPYVNQGLQQNVDKLFNNRSKILLYLNTLNAGMVEVFLGTITDEKLLNDFRVDDAIYESYNVFQYNFIRLQPSFNFYSNMQKITDGRFD